MKTLFASLAVVLALAVASTASAGVFVHAGPVSVGVGGYRHYYHPRPVVARPVVARPVMARPVVAPVVVPAPAYVAPSAASSPGWLDRSERRELRAEIRQAIQN